MIREKDKKVYKKKIKRLTEKYASRRFVLFGVSHNTRFVAQCFRECNVEPYAIVDNDVRKQGLEYFGLPCYSLEELLGDYKPDVVIVIMSGAHLEMDAQIAAMGYKKWQRQRLYIGIQETEPYSILHSLQGLHYYNQLRKSFGDDATFLIFPYTGTGDVYLAATFLDEFIRVNNISDPVIVAPSKACLKVAAIFGYTRVEQVPYDNICKIIAANVFAPELCPFYMMNDSYTHTNGVQFIRGHKGLNFTDMYRIGVFGLPEASKPVMPKLELTDEIKAFISEHQLDEKSVLISPYSNTLSLLPDSMWVELVKLLKSEGFRVLTNSCGASEPAIEGSEPIFFPLSWAIQILGVMGGFIGIRSGFCDIASAATCKKIVLYNTADSFFAGSAFEYFSIKEMGLSDDVIELGYNPNDDISDYLKSIFAKWKE